MPNEKKKMTPRHRGSLDFAATGIFQPSESPARGLQLSREGQRAQRAIDELRRELQTHQDTRPEGSAQTDSDQGVGSRRG